MKGFLIGFLFATAAAYPAGLFSIGVKGGVPLNDAFSAAKTGNISYFTNNNRYTVGPEVELNLPFGLGIEVDALYRRLEFQAESDTTQARTTANAWSFPVLLKKRFGPGPFKPYLSAGPTFRGLTNIKERIRIFSGTQTTDNPASLRNNFTTGFTAAAGLQLGGEGIRLSPEIRYTRWGWENFRSVNSLLRSNPDQWDFLVGITF
jgi:opacity protein-like surface antigen